MGVIWGGWRLLGLNRPCWVLEGLRGRKEGPEPQESERREGKLQEALWRRKSL